MKVTEINRFIQQHLLPTLPGYTATRDMLYTITVDFFLKGYYVESRGNGEYGLAVWYFIQPLFLKQEDILLTYGDRLHYKKKINWISSKKLEWWDARKEKVEESFQSILHSILSEGEPILNALNTPQDFYQKFKSEIKDNIRVYEAVALSTILWDDIDLQNQLLHGLITFSTKKIHRDTDWVDQIREDADLLLKAGTTQDRRRILEAWKKETLAQLKLPSIK